MNTTDVKVGKGVVGGGVVEENHNNFINTHY
jgi:hypothetical protein